MSQKLYKIFSKDYKILGVPPINCNRTKGSLSLSHIVNFIYMFNALLTIPVFSKKLENDGDNILNFIVLESHFALFALMYSLIIKLNVYNIIKKSKFAQVVVIQNLFYIIGISLVFEILKSVNIFNEFISVFKNNSIISKHSQFHHLDKNYLILLVIHLLFNNNYSFTSNFNCFVSLFLGFSIFHKYQTIMKVRIILFTINVLIYIPDMFKYLIKINNKFSYLQLAISYFLLGFLITSDISSNLKYDFFIIGLIAFCNLFFTTIYLFIFNTCYYYRKERINGKWDLPKVIDYY